MGTLQQAGGVKGPGSGVRARVQSDCWYNWTARDAGRWSDRGADLAVRVPSVGS